jgi:Uma2 family endonuclease
MVTLEEYLTTAYEEGDREYVDGEIQERNLGEQPHSLTQTSLAAFLFNRRARSGVSAC